MPGLALEQADEAKRKGTPIEINPECSSLYAGSKFVGHQRSGHNSYQVTVQLQDWPELCTFFEAEVIGPHQGFLTRKWDADESIDKQHWMKFPAFAPHERTFNTDGFTYNFATSDVIFMRWKEQFLVPDHRIKSITGASFAGFYYIAFQKSTGSITGYYFHQNSEMFQHLSLNHKGVNTDYDLIWDAIKRLPESRSFGYRVGGSPYVWTSFADIGKLINKTGQGLLKLGTLKASTTHGADPVESQLVGICMKNSFDWSILDFTCSTFGLVSVALFPTFDEESLVFVLNKSLLTVIAVSEEEISKILNVAGQCKSLKHIILCGCAAVSKEVSERAKALGLKVTTIKDIQNVNDSKEVAHVIPQPEDVVTICFTSGTSGLPKGVMITHGNMAAAAAGVINMLPSAHKFTSRDRHLSYLPLCHMFERAVFHALFWCGAEVGYFRGSIEQLFDDLLELKPTLFPTVPRLLIRLYDKVTQGVEMAGGVKKALFKMAYNSKLRDLRNGICSRDTIWDKLVFSKIQARLGGNVRLMITGAAPISADILEFLRVVMGCQVLEGYGQSESTASGCLTLIGDYRPVSHVGVPFTSCEVKLVDVPSMNYFASDQPNPRGEICLRGNVIMKGYFKDPELTAEAIDDDGWLHTGDVGMLLPTGTIAIIDRKKSQFKLQQGEYISPEKVEMKVKTPFIQQIWVYGDSLRSSPIAVVVLDQDYLMPWAKANGFEGKSYEELANSPEINKQILDGMVKEGKKNNLVGYEIPKAIFISSKTFEAVNLLTPTFKIKRHEAKLYFNAKIEELYSKL
ncbi:Long-chain-fatty-acid--CoA ligase 5 [Chytridiales sp. JEL 0842]|nr:Long-chain-fatty-acid--CoA ligase 5 [Chytridiales sp. JEL 0842]